MINNETLMSKKAKKLILKYSLSSKEQELFEGNPLLIKKAETNGKNQGKKERNKF